MRCVNQLAHRLSDLRRMLDATMLKTTRWCLIVVIINMKNLGRTRSRDASWTDLGRFMRAAAAGESISRSSRHWMARAILESQIILPRTRALPLSGEVGPHRPPVVLPPKALGQTRPMNDTACLG